MDSRRAADELKVIRHLMERPVRYTTQSGLAGVLAGCAALLGLGADAFVSRRYDPRHATLANLLIWGGVFVVAFLAAVICTRLRERKEDMPFWSAAKKRIAMTILPPFVAGVGLTLAIVYHWWAGDGPNMWGLIPAIWMTFYGVACWQVGEFSTTELRWLGGAFVLSGLVAAVLPHAGPVPVLAEMGREIEMPYFTVGLTFGGYHLLYGIIVWMRHGG
ncbi:MAG: hypothetical protein ACOCWV_00215 [Planctomycetota bacterium]